MSRESASVAVIIPTFNRADYLATSLESVLKQTVPPQDVVVVDDGSRDHTADVMAEYSGRVRYMRKDNGGKASAVNHALPSIETDYLWVFDDDDVACPDALERHLEVLESDPSVGFTYSGAYTCSSGTNGWLCIEYVSPARPFDRDEALYELMMSCFTASPAVVVRMSVVRRCGLHRPELARSGDLEIAIRWLLDSECARVDDGAPTYYRRYHSGLRGPMGAQFSYGVNDDKAREFERYIFRLPDLGVQLHHYLPRSEWSAPLEGSVLVRARVRRFALALRKGLWEVVESDLEWLSQHKPTLDHAGARERWYLCRALQTHASVRGLIYEPSSRPIRSRLRRLDAPWIQAELVRGMMYFLARLVRNREWHSSVGVTLAMFRVFSIRLLRIALSARSIVRV